MDMSRAFKLTIQKFNIRAVDISRSSGVAESDVSRFLNGKTDSGYKKVDKLINALPPVAKDYFWLVYKSGDSVFFSHDAEPDRRLAVCESGGKYQ
jgi:hypothetical protein